MLWLIIIEILNFFGPNSTSKMRFNQELQCLMLFCAGMIDSIYFWLLQKCM